MITRWRRSIPIYAAIPLAAAGGLTLSAAFPEPGIWWLALPGVAIIVWSLVGRRWWTALLIGLTASLTFWLTLIDWLTLYLGLIPWLALACVMTLWMTLWAVIASFVMTHAHRLWSSPGKQVAFVPLVVSGLWVAREGIASVWPYGGFSWGRVAQSQADGVFGHLVSWVSTAGLSFLIVWIATSVVVLIRLPGARWLWTLPTAVVVLALLIPSFPIQIVGTTRIGAVQGNADAGLFSGYTPGEILSDHLTASESLVRKPVDVVVWPENGNDIDPLRDETSATLIDDLAGRLSAPIVFGTITHPASGEYFNSSLVWEHGLGAVGQYDKIHPVPFAEYMPERDFFHALVPDLVDLVTRDYGFGQRSNVIDIAGIPMGISICFDITDDQQAYDMARNGAEIVLAQTNNADFGHTDESLQQVAIARLRAMEMGRTVVNISTVGLSQVIAPDGSTIDTLPRFTAGAMLVDAPRSTTVTPAMAWGRAIEIGLSLIGIVGFALVAVRTAQSRRRASLFRDVTEDKPNVRRE